MSEFTKTDFNAGDYSNFRPSYPPEWYRTLNEFHKGNRNLVIDVGCGPGTATFDISRNLSFKRVIGADISEPMIEKAKGRAIEVDNSVKFVVYNGELDDILSRDPFNPSSKQVPDLITMAECAHWMDWDTTLEQVAKILPSRGTLAVWGYVDPAFVDFPELDDEIEKLQYGDAPFGLGPYWQQPGRQRLRDLYPQLPPSEKWFTDINLWRHDIRSQDNNNTPLIMEKKMTLEAFDKYTTTWSSYHKWQQVHQKQNDGSINAINPRTIFLNKVYKHTGLKSHDLVRVAWKTVALLARRK
ncbi:hypothetical protein KDRO_C00800 [Kluyveromyces lactis]|nr:hypothetical protein KDRO_C00800 [Kluyveromyces lactis]